MKHSFIILLLINTLISFGQISINEVQSSNQSTIADNKGDFDDWIELHNATADTIEIGGLIFKDKIDTWAIPTGDSSTLIPPNGYFLLWADDEESQGIFHTNFKLASGGEFLGLYESDGITVIDSITLPAISRDNSYFKCNSTWKITNTPTPQTDNNCVIDALKNELPNDLFITQNNRELIIDIKSSFQESRSISIYSADGKERINSNLNKQKTIINLQTLETGIYIISIPMYNSVYSERISIKN